VRDCFRDFKTLSQIEDFNAGARRDVDTPQAGSDSFIGKSTCQSLAGPSQAADLLR